MNTVPRPDAYEEIQLHSDGVPIVLSVWHADPALTTVVFPLNLPEPPRYYQFEPLHD